MKNHLSFLLPVVSMLLFTNSIAANAVPDRLANCSKPHVGYSVTNEGSKQFQLTGLDGKPLGLIEPGETKQVIFCGANDPLIGELRKSESVRLEVSTNTGSMSKGNNGIERIRGGDPF